MINFDDIIFSDPLERGIPMIINFGKYAGKSVEFLILKQPEYVKWILDSDGIIGPLFRVKEEILRLINIFFDRKLFLRK